MRLNDILKSIGLQGFNEDLDIVGINELKKARNHELSFITSKKYIDDLKETKAGAIFITPGFEKFVPKGAISIVCDDPYLMMAKASRFFKKPLVSKEFIEPIVGEGSTIQEGAHVGSGCVIGRNVTILSGASIGENVQIGDDSTLYPNVTIYNDTIIGKNCIIHAGSVVGSDGFGYAHTKDGKHVKIYHNGNVIVEDDVEIGANCTIDRAVFGSTIIKKGTKIDNLVQIGHNCEIGEYSILVSQVGLSGSTKLGRNVIMGGQSASAGHLKIGDFATIAARGGVSKSIEGGKVYGGFPLILQKDWLKLQAKILKLTIKTPKKE